MRVFELFFRLNLVQKTKVASKYELFNLWHRIGRDFSVAVFRPASVLAGTHRCDCNYFNFSIFASIFEGALMVKSFKVLVKLKKADLRSVLKSAFLVNCCNLLLTNDHLVVVLVHNFRISAFKRNQIRINIGFSDFTCKVLTFKLKGHFCADSHALASSLVNAFKYSTD